MCRTLGTPKPIDRAFLTEEGALKYLDFICQDNRKCTLSQLFPTASRLAQSLLKGLLEFNPYFRLSAKEALQHPLFDKVRQPKFERPCPVHISESIDAIIEINESTYKHQHIPAFKQILLTEQSLVRNKSLLH